MLDISIYLICIVTVILVPGVGLYCRLVGRQDILDVNVNPDIINGLPTVIAPLL